MRIMGSSENGILTGLLNVTSQWLQENGTGSLTNNKSSNGTLMDLENENGYVPFRERPETYIVPVLFAIIFIIGVLGNGTLILIFLRHRTMRNVPNMYICSLAVGDILVILFCVPFTSPVYTVESWPYGLIVCKFSEFIRDVSIGVSVFTLTALSADRYFAIVDPMRKMTGCRANQITGVTIAGIWLVSILIALPSGLFSYIRVIDEDPAHTFLVCYPFPPQLTPAYPKVMVMFKFLAFYAIPLVLIATFYIVMARHLVLSTRKMPGEAQGQGKQIQGRKKVAKMILSLVVIFALCFFPNHVFMLWFYFDPNSEENFNEFWNYLRIIGFCLGFINSCINPITLYCLSGTFRKYFNKYLFCCGRVAKNRRSRTARGGQNILGCGANACVNVNMNNSTHHAYGDRQKHGAGTDQYRNQAAGRVGVVKVGAMYRGGSAATTNYSLNSNYKRKCTWESPNDATRRILLNNLNVAALNIPKPNPNHTNPNFPLASISLTPEQHRGQRVTPTPSPSRSKGSGESSPSRLLFLPTPALANNAVEELAMSTFVIVPATVGSGNSEHSDS